MFIDKSKKSFCFIFIITGDYGKFHRKAMIEKFADFVAPNPVIVLNRPFDFVTSVIKKPKKIFEKTFKNLNAENLFLFTPHLFIHEQLLLNTPKSFREFNLSIFKRELKKISKNLCLDTLKKVVWCMHPDLMDYINVIPKDYLIYDCYDEFIVPNAIKGINEREKELINISDLVITSSKYLKQKKESVYDSNKIFYSPTAVNVELFRNPQNEIPQDIKNIPHPIIGFAGSFREDIDTDLITFIAKERKNWSLVFVGKVFSKSTQDKINNLENVHFLGEKTLSDFAVYQNIFDVAVCPHKLTEFIMSSSPYKIYQYLASNLDIVCTPFPEAINFHSKVAVGYSKEEFLKKIESFLTKEKINFTETEFANLSWESRFKNIFDQI